MSRYVYISRAKSTNVAALKFFSAVFVSALLHVLTLFGGRFPVAAASLRLSQRPDPRRSHGRWERGMLCLGVFGRFMSGHVGSSRRKSGQSGCFSFFCGHCCRCAFACVDPFVGSISGMSRFTYIIPQNSCLFGDNFPDGSASGLFPLYPFSVPFFSVAHCSMCDLHFGRRLLSEL